MCVKTCRKKKRKSLGLLCSPGAIHLDLSWGCDRVSLIWHSTISLGWLAGQQAPETCLSLPPQCWACKHAPPRPAFYMFAGDRAYVLELYPLSHPPSPKNYFPEQLAIGKYWEITELWWNSLRRNFKITFFEDVKPVENPQHKTFLLFPTSEIEPSARQVV